MLRLDNHVSFGDCSASGAAGLSTNTKCCCEQIEARSDHVKNQAKQVSYAYGLLDELSLSAFSLVSDSVPRGPSSFSCCCSASLDRGVACTLVGCSDCSIQRSAVPQLCHRLILLRPLLRRGQLGGSVRPAGLQGACDASIFVLSGFCSGFCWLNSSVSAILTEQLARAAGHPD